MSCWKGLSACGHPAPSSPGVKQSSPPKVTAETFTCERHTRFRQSRELSTAASSGKDVPSGFDAISQRIGIINVSVPVMVGGRYVAGLGPVIFQLNDAFDSVGHGTVAVVPGRMDACPDAGAGTIVGATSTTSCVESWVVPGTNVSAIRT